MSGMQFVIDFVRALVWPAAIVAIVACLRRPTADILMQLASGLRRLRAGQSDAEFGRIAGQMKAELTASVSPGGPGPEAIPVLLAIAAQRDGPLPGTPRCPRRGREGWAGAGRVGRGGRKRLSYCCPVVA